MPADHILRRVREVARALGKAEALLVTAGAGMSVDSGLPDYRGNKGFWRAYPPLEKLGIPFERMAQPYWFVEKPRMAWAWYGHRAQLYRQATPHAGHDLLREWMMAMPAGGFVATSNVDGQFAAAGCAERGVYELHGNIHRLQCVEPCRDEVWSAELPDLRIDLETLTAQGELPRCPACGALARPNVLMFNDGCWVDAVAREQGRRFDQWLTQVRGRRLVILELGAGKALPTIRRLGERIAERSLVTLVRINPDARQEEESLIALPMGALEALTAIREARKPRSRAKVAAVLERPLALGSSGAALGGLRESAPASWSAQVDAGRTPPSTFLRLADLDTGVVEPLSFSDISAADQQSCYRALYEGPDETWLPLPQIAAHTPCGYRMNVGVLMSGDPESPATQDAAVITFVSPENVLVLTVAVARRPAQATKIWKWLYESAKTRLTPIEQPRLPWVARRHGPGAREHKAMLGELMAMARTVALVWLTVERRRDEDD